MSFIVSDVMTGWEFPFAELVGDQLKEEWSRLWANTGVSSISFAQNVRNLSLATATMREKDWPIARPTIINCLAIFVTCATK